MSVFSCLLRDNEVRPLPCKFKKKSFAPPSGKKSTHLNSDGAHAKFGSSIHAMTITLLLKKKKLYTKRYANFACKFVIHFGSMDS